MCRLYGDIAKFVFDKTHVPFPEVHIRDFALSMGNLKCTSHLLKDHSILSVHISGQGDDAKT